MIHGGRLRQAREFAGLTQAELAQDLGIAQSRLSDAEHDRYRLPEPVAVEAAAVLGFAPGFFTAPPAVEISGTPAHLRSRAAGAAEEKRARRAGEVVLEQLLRMLAFIEPLPLRISAQAGADPAEAAASVRAVLGARPDQPLTGLIFALEHAGLLVVGLPVPARRRLDAFSFWHDRLPVLCLLDGTVGDQRTWAAAHELGHLVLDPTAAPTRAEEQAEAFAAHLLLPSAALAADLPPAGTLQQLTMLKHRWGVPLPALIRTVHRRGHIDTGRYTGLIRQISARGERLRDRVTQEPVKPRGFRKISGILYGPAPAQALAADAGWTPGFADTVLSLHATADELPHHRPRRTVDNVVTLHRRGSTRPTGSAG